MASPRKDSDTPARRRPPATTPQARENQMIALTVDLVEKQLRDGTASSQVMTHYLRQSSGEEQLKRAKLEQEVELLRAKVAQIESGQRIEELYDNAIHAMRSYQGQEEDIPNDY